MIVTVPMFNEKNHEGRSEIHPPVAQILQLSKSEAQKTEECKKCAITRARNKSDNCFYTEISGPP